MNEGGELFDQLSDYRLLKKYSDPCSSLCFCDDFNPISDTREKNNSDTQQNGKCSAAAIFGATLYWNINTEKKCITRWNK
jgi:hypothetical protein